MLDCSVLTPIRSEVRVAQVVDFTVSLEYAEVFCYHHAPKRDRSEPVFRVLFIHLSCRKIPFPWGDLRKQKRLTTPMKPLMSRTEDTSTLQDLGRASVQIVHDLKNQLNGLKLYATFLRKRLEKSERPKDEQEVLGKLISGLDRAADDLSIIVQYGRTIELKKQTAVDLPRILRDICSNLKETSFCKVSFESESETLKGEFDPAMLKEAFNSICVVATKLRRDKDGPGAITVSVKPGNVQAKPGAIIEWSGLRDLDHDPFKSFAGSDEIKMSLAAKIVEAHDGLAQYKNNSLVVILPLS